MLYVYFKAVGRSYASSRAAMLEMQSKLVEMGIFDLAEYSFRFDTHYIGLVVPKRNFARIIAKVNNSRLFVCSHADGNLFFTYSVSCL